MFVTMRAMNKTYKTQAITLLIVGIGLLPSIYFLFFASYPNDQMGFYKLLSYIVFPLPALASIVCIALGLGRLHAAKSQPLSPVESVSTDGRIRPVEYRRAKNNFIALSAVTVLMGLIGLMALWAIIYLISLPGGLLLLVFPGLVPVSVFVFTVVIGSLNVKKIFEQKRALDSMTNASSARVN